MYPRTESIKNSDELRNITCHEYLSYIQRCIMDYLAGKNITIPADILALTKFLLPAEIPYEKSALYGNDYTGFMETLDANIAQLRQKYQHTPLYPLLNILVDTVYHNPNKGLERATEMIKNILASSHEEKESVATRIENRMAKSRKKKLTQFLLWQQTNASTPHKTGTPLQRLIDTRLGILKVQHKTNMPNIRKYKYKNSSLPTEYRFGTQAQFDVDLTVGRVASVAPMFKIFLENQKEKLVEKMKESKESASPITHVYFNNLKLMNFPNQMTERGVEGCLTQVLNNLEEYDNVAVITLPADNDLISYHSLQEPGEKEDVAAALSEMKEMVSGDHTPEGLDFYISLKIRKLLFDSKDEQDKIINDLLQKSLVKLGLETKKKITSAEKQALYFHFIKFELTNFILEKLKPVSFNISCKDAIDRGGVASAYYNLMKSLEMGEPLDENEFNYALYGASLLVKGRSMNDHFQLIWNAVKTYTNNPRNKPLPDWLIKWCAQQQEVDHKTETVEALTDYINKNSSNDVNKISAAKKLKELIDNKHNTTISFTWDEWKTFYDGRLKDIFTTLTDYLSDEQQGKIKLLQELYQQILTLKTPYPAYSQSAEYNLGKKLWLFVNSNADNNNLLTRYEQVRIKNIPELAPILKKIENLREKKTSCVVIQNSQ